MNIVTWHIIRPLSFTRGLLFYTFVTMHTHDPIYNITTPAHFENCALALFNYQFESNPVYRSFCDLLYIHPSEVKRIEQIPFLPIEFFKTHAVHTQKEDPSLFFTSSGTTQTTLSKHYIADIKEYIQCFTGGFDHAYGDIKQYALLALLPSYLERRDSSLIYMVDHLITASANDHSGFYLDNYFALSEKIKLLERKGQKTILMGVSFALLDLLEKYSFNLSHTLIMETGGMKGRRKEMVREELHTILKKGFGVSQVHSEYGMTELYSQAYSRGNGLFTPPPWMKVLVRDPADPFTLFPPNKTGGLSIIDLANKNSCPFIATQDLGKLATDGTFTVTGRFDHADIRGCNLLAL